MESRRVPLSREQIVEEARAMIEAEGLPRFSMVRLAKRLERSDMALNKRMGGRDGLLDAVLESLLSEVELPQEAEGQDWLAELRRLYSALWELFRAHPEVLPALAQRPLTLPAIKRCQEQSLRLLLAQGCSEQEATRVLATLTAFTLGYANLVCGGYLSLGELERPAPPKDSRTRRQPGMSCALPAGDPDWERLEGEFEVGLEMVLRGVEQELA